MKITVSRNDLLKELNVLLPAVPSKSRLPILTSFLFRLDTTAEVGDMLTVVASDGDIFLTTVVVPVTSDGEEGSFLIEARTLVSTLKLIPEQPVTLVIEKREKGHLTKSFFPSLLLRGCPLRWKTIRTRMPCCIFSRKAYYEDAKKENTYNIHLFKKDKMKHESFDIYTLDENNSPYLEAEGIQDLDEAIDFMDDYGEGTYMLRGCEYECYFDVLEKST
jgi:hypothetical protein